MDSLRSPTIFMREIDHFGVQRARRMVDDPIERSEQLMGGQV
jgi:hypothetical protein